MWQMQDGSIPGNSRVHADEHLWSEHADVVSPSEQRAIYAYMYALRHGKLPFPRCNFGKVFLEILSSHNLICIH